MAQTAGKHKNRSFGGTLVSRKAKGCEQRQKGRARKGTRSRQSTERAQEESPGIQNKENIKEKMLPTSISATRAQSVTL